MIRNGREGERVRTNSSVTTRTTLIPLQERIGRREWSRSLLLDGGGDGPDRFVGETADHRSGRGLRDWDAEDVRQRGEHRGERAHCVCGVWWMWMLGG